MLDERIVDKLVERLTNRIEQANTYTLKKIGETIGEIGTLTPEKARNVINIIKYGGNYDKIIRKLAKVTELNVKDIEEIFEEVAKKDYEFAEEFYKYRNIKYIPYEKNNSLQRQVKALANITANEYINISKTTGFARIINGKKVYEPMAQVYQEAIDNAVISVIQGKSTYTEQMYKTIKELSSSGIKTIDYASGYSRRLDSSVNMNMRGAIRDLHNEVQKIIGKEINSDGVEISVHSNPAPDHEEVQGHQFSNEEFNKFQNNQDAVDYQGKIFTADYEGRDRRSIGEYNCYHSIFSIILGVNKPQYTNKQLQNIINANEDGFTFDNKHYTNYEGTQLQRKLETEIRKENDKKIMLKSAYNNKLSNEAKNKIKSEIEKSKVKISNLSKTYKKISNISGLPTKLEKALYSKM